ncbi:TIM-barrel domain-containing protein [Clostridium sp.]|uniref:TIM-barrel domain-containing protein n=1 Tax=Clostridium sp. TaxID=1506 RepID=UPI0026246039|nr:TIM-barrel domain-containing protein [Clostridium sp.]
MRSNVVNNQIIKYTFGTPFNTESVVLKEGKELHEKEIKYFKFENNTLIFELKDEDLVYGLGENVRGLNKRGWVYESFCTDDFSHTPEKKSLYGAHNFIMIYGEKTFGLFIDHPGRVKFDVGYTNSNELKITLDDDNFALYIIEGESLNKITKNFRELIGKSYVAPKWGFGVQQSRWSYKDRHEVLEVLDNYENSQLPIDCLYLDIDYMEDFKNFTINKKAFPEFESFVKEIKERGVRLIPIIDAGCKIEDGYDVYEEGVKNGYYCLDEDGQPFVAAVWPGRVLFPDFLNKDARKWFGSKYKFLTDKGIEGFWNDMNEPAIFYSEKRLNEAFEKISEAKGKNLGIYDYFDVKDTFPRLQNSMEDYQSFYHRVGNEKVRHDKVHNLFGFNMTRAAFEGLENIEENKRFLLFSRASIVGMHRFGGIWTGDNMSWWEHIKLNMQMMSNINMCGFIYTGADCGGFGGDATEDLVIRWSQFSMFTPLFRNHAALGTRHQEPYSFRGESVDVLKNILELRYVMVPYLYSEYMKAVLNNEMYFKPLTFEYNDKFVKRIEDQLLLGDSLMVAPIYEQNSLGRYVYLPEEMLLWRARKYDDGDYEVLGQGHHYIDAKLNEVPMFIRKNKIVTMASKPSKRVEDLDTSRLNLVAFVDDEAEYIYYNDDGITKNYEKGDFEELKVKIKKVDSDYKVTVDNNSKVRNLNIKIFDLNKKVIEKEILV